MGVFCVCFGESENNLSISLTKRIIGVNQRRNFGDAEVYLIIKRNNQWTVVAKATVDGESQDNPFPKPNKYVRYSLKTIQECKPYSITDILKEEFGNAYGLTLRSPNLITADRFVSELAKRFANASK